LFSDKDFEFAHNTLRSDGVNFLHRV